ncbi:30S ribosomal protein S26e [Candidatus Mancarchaeum acidiphilum]|uniref:30S ribosomal protein S26e n=1 Tax=Candidatus Mancarchaeum acidiphilum TaxID=1920749 RepID=A0A218NNF9_9ARCH|nr:30S ribosomal protein S26e [Candidatus Mancarchaeum acidiphilum]
MARRGRETLVTCESCGRKVPRSKAVDVEKFTVFSTDMKTNKDIRFTERNKVFYCISCAKHRGIFEMKKRQAMSRANRRLE